MGVPGAESKSMDCLCVLCAHWAESTLSDCFFQHLPLAGVLPFTRMLHECAYPRHETHLLLQESFRPYSYAFDKNYVAFVECGLVIDNARALEYNARALEDPIEHTIAHNCTLEHNNATMLDWCNFILLHCSIPLVL